METPEAALARPLIADVRAVLETEKRGEERVGILLLIARCQQKLGERDEARKTVAEAVERVRKLPAAEQSPMLLPSVAFDVQKLGDPATARALLGEALAQGRAQKDPARRFFTVASVAQMQAVLGDRAGARTTLQTLRRLDPKRAASDEGLWLESFTRADTGDIAGGLKAAAQVKSPRERGQLLAQISTRQRKAGDVAGAKATMAKARAILATEKDATMREMTESLVLGELVAQGEAAEATRLAGKNARLRESVAGALLARGQRKAALALNPPASPDLVYSHAAAGEIPAAKAAMEKANKERSFSMQDDPIRMLGAIAAAQARAGDAAGAAESLEEAKKQARTPDDVFGDRSAALLASLMESVLFGGWRRREES